MGLAMATNMHKYLQSQSHKPLLFYNRTPSRGDKLETSGAERCTAVGELSRKSDVVFISASDDAAVESIIGEMILSGTVEQDQSRRRQKGQEKDLKGKMVLDTTTIHPDTTRRISEMLRKQGVDYAALPVFGATPVAEQGELLVAFAGPENVYKAVGPLIRRSIAREILRAGNEPEKAMLLKTTG
jgi:3-hydroxyisobutyrate dehydrogenase-like beta-hydroxyacid dehydrogenase